MLNPRAVALDALTHISTDKIEVEDALARTGFDNLDGRDRGFAYTLLLHTLRWGRAADHVLASYMETLLPERKQRARWAMRMGVVQLRVLATPAHAAVSETVALLKKNKAEKAYSGLANAVLKRIAQDAPTLEPVRALPAWLADSWRRAYGEQALYAMAELMLKEATLDVSVPHNREHWAEALGGRMIGAQSVRLNAEVAARDVTTLPGFEDGAWWVQDVAATLPVHMLGEVKGKHVLELCAAPGGKTSQLCAAGAAVTALDRSPSRMKRLKENMQRLRLQPQCVEADALRWAPDRQYDAILLDAPCSATGTLRRHPEMGWIRGESDHVKLVGIQREMLARAWEWLSPGGALVYAVCSLQPEEGEAQMAWACENLPHATIEKPVLGDEVVPQAAWNEQGTLRLLPHMGEAGGYDGFFAAKLVKSA